MFSMDFVFLLFVLFSKVKVVINVKVCRMSCQNAYIFKKIYFKFWFVVLHMSIGYKPC